VKHVTPIAGVRPPKMRNRTPRRPGDNRAMTTTEPTPDPAPPGRPGDLAQHYKGGLYRIESFATLEADGSPAVVYRPLADPAQAAWVRALSVFDETVEGLDGEARPRFAVLPLPDGHALRTAASAAGLPAPMVEGALARYREAGRHYHALWHPQDLFARAAADGLALSRAQTLALLFHDAVHVPGAPAGTNEALSAMLLEQAAHAAPWIGADEIALACTIVRDTATHRASVPEAEPVVALDLATLADAPIRFDAWTEMVWLEYRHLFAGEPDPKAAFLRRRMRVLGALLEAVADRPMRPAFHARAAANLERLARRPAA
jgi:predicted metal-dependent HD superfamily phosphohydrolase